MAATKYWRRQNIRVNKIIGTDKIIGRIRKTWHRLKHWRNWKNLALTKTLAELEKIGGGKNLALEKIGAGRCRRIPLLLGSAESAAADFSQDLLMLLSSFSQAPLKISYFYQTSPPGSPPSLRLVHLDLPHLPDGGVDALCACRRQV